MFLFLENIEIMPTFLIFSHNCNSMMTKYIKVLVFVPELNYYIFIFFRFFYTKHQYNITGKSLVVCLKIKIKIHQHLKKCDWSLRSRGSFLGENYNWKNGGCKSKNLGGRGVRSKPRFNIYKFFSKEISKERLRT